MEMRGAEDIEPGQDLTPPLFPLTAALYDAFLPSHCSSCFSPLPNPPLPPTNPPNRPLYCSAACSSRDIPAAQSLPSDLRAALRFILSISPQPSNAYDRISGLLTNRDKILSSPEDSDQTRAEKIRAEARVLAAARRSEDESVGETDDFSLEEAVLCLLQTNEAAVLDKEGRHLGHALFPPGYSWINHSCSPNAWYGALISPPDAPSPPREIESTFKIVPAVAGSKELQGCSALGIKNGDIQGKGGGYGPRLIVRSIKRIKKGDVVTLPYTDVLQPKATRQSDLWSIFRFICSCPRCAASPPTYVDRALEEISASEKDCSDLGSAGKFDRVDINRKLADYVHKTDEEYLCHGDPESCCEKLENMLNLGLPIKELDEKQVKPCVNIKLHPLHDVALRAYTTLASTYKVRSDDSLALTSDDTDEHQAEAFRMSRASAAYSLLLAGATHYLFRSESSLIVYAGMHWSYAGELLIHLVKSSGWSLPANPTNLSSLATHKCSKCSLMDIFNTVSPQGKSVDLEFISRQFLDCVTDLIPKIWGFLVHGFHYLQTIQNPIDFSWVGKIPGDICHGDEALGRYSDEERVHVYRLAVHCWLYAGILDNICHGEDSSFSTHSEHFTYSLIYGTNQIRVILDEWNSISFLYIFIAATFQLEQVEGLYTSFKPSK